MNRFNKKLIVSLIILSLLLLCFTVCAEDNNEPAVLLSSAAGNAGDEVTVDIILQNNPGIAYLKLEIDYDLSLSTVRAENKEVLLGTFTTSKTTSVKPYILQWMGAENSTGNGIIATVTFKIPDNAGIGDKEISVGVAEC